MRIWIACWFLLVSTCALAGAVEEIWHYDTACGAFVAPTAIDHDGGTRDVVVVTRYDGTVWLVSAKGAALHHTSSPRWIEGPAAVVDRPQLLVYEESSGRVNVHDPLAKTTASVLIEGDPVVGAGVCVADIDANDVSEILCARRNGIVTALDLKLSPLWQYDAGAPIRGAMAAAPVYPGRAAVYVYTEGGVLHAVAGDGLPVWQFQTNVANAREASLEGPVVAQLGGAGSVVLFSDSEGRLYALNAADGREQWRVRIGTGSLGAPAILDRGKGRDREILVANEDGAFARIDASGTIVQEAKLPPARYVSKPLVADVDGDGAPEILIPNRDWKIVIASLDGHVKQTLELRGNAVGGMTLADLDGNGTLELVAATDCARVHCFATRAKTGWPHPRANAALNGSLPPIAPAPAPAPETADRRVRIESINISNYVERAPFATAFVRTKGQKGVRSITAVIRQNGAIAGATHKAAAPEGITIPFLQRGPEEPYLDIAFEDQQGKPIGASTGIPIRPSKLDLMKLTAVDDFIETLARCGDRYTVPKAWSVPSLAGRDAWILARFMPETWKKHGLDTEPFVRDAIPCVWSPAAGGAPLFGPQHTQWPAIQADTKPFFVLNGLYPEQPYPKDLCDSIRDMAGARFLGFPVYHWGEMAWEKRIASAKSKPATVEELALALKADFERLADRCGDRMCAGMSRCLFFHQAYEWGAPIAFAEVGEQTPCASLQFAFLRGAARQYHGRPWGTSLVNEFCGAVADARYLPQASQTIWTMPNQVRGAQCGHSPSLELRLAMAAHLAGATFVQDESDARNGSSFVQEDESGLHTLSPFGTNLKTVHQFMGDFPQRGVPYTPVAFVVDFHRCWQLGEENFGPWSPEASDRSIEAMFRHVYAYDGHCDFERGILTSSPYGDLFDVITDNAPRGVLGTYGVLWPLGNVVIGGAHQEAMVDYVKKGGILILDAFIAKVFASQFLGVAFGTDIGVATQIQTPLAALPPLAAPYLYRGMTVSRNTGVLAWTDTGAPLLTWRKSGKGLVLVAASEHWLDQRNQLLPLAPALLRAIADAFSPVQVSADVQVLINRDADGWILGLINNNGVSKVPTQPATADPKDMADCMIYFKKGVPLQFISRFGQFGWNNTANGLHTRLQPGELAVVKAAFTSDAQR